MGAGGGTDLIARVVIEGARRYIPNNQPIIPVNRPGAGGAIGAEAVMRARPDGYTLLFPPLSTIACQPHFGVARYTHDSFQPVIRTTEGMHVFIVRADAPWKTWNEFVEFAKKNPGKITYASPGAGTTSHLSTEWLSREHGMRLVHVPFDSGAAAQNALLGGHVDAAGLLAVGEIDRSRFRVLLNLGTKKTPDLRNVPTMGELGYRISFPVTSGIVAPKGTPPEVVAVIHDAFKKAIEDPEIIQRLEKVNAVPYYGNAEEQQKEFTEFYHTYGRIMRAAGIIQ